MSTAYFAMGCFWKPEVVFRKLNGVTNVTVGYCGGTKENPNYDQVCRGGTGHAETLKIEFDPNKISYDKLLKVFWDNHHYGFGNREDMDSSDQYRSAVFSDNEDQHKAAIALRELKESGRSRALMTAIEPLKKFWPAEEYHQQYLAKAERA